MSSTRRRSAERSMPIASRGDGAAGQGYARGADVSIGWRIEDGIIVEDDQ